MCAPLVILLNRFSGKQGLFVGFPCRKNRAIAPGRKICIPLTISWQIDGSEFLLRLLADHRLGFERESGWIQSHTTQIDSVQLHLPIDSSPRTDGYASFHDHLHERGRCGADRNDRADYSAQIDEHNNCLINAGNGDAVPAFYISIDSDCVIFVSQHAEYLKAAIFYFKVRSTKILLVLIKIPLIDGNILGTS